MVYLKIAYWNFQINHLFLFTVIYKYQYTEIIYNLGNKTVLYLICNRIVNGFVGVQERLAAVNHIYVFREAMRLALNM